MVRRGNFRKFKPHGFGFVTTDRRRRLRSGGRTKNPSGKGCGSDPTVAPVALNSPTALPAIELGVAISTTAGASNKKNFFVANKDNDVGPAEIPGELLDGPLSSPAPSS